MSKILLLEDDLSLVDALSYSLRKQGFDLSCARTVRDAMQLINQGDFELLILDVSLPDGSGFDVCKAVRQSSKVPIIFLTAADEELNVIMGLDIGGDDYIAKPFKLGVLISRINALLRRSGALSASGELHSNGIRLSPLSGQAENEKGSLDLTATEYRLLCLFMQNPGRVLTRENILAALWDAEGDFVDDNTLAVYIRRLRMKIEADPGEPKMLLTVRGRGYKWSTENGGDGR